jgi:hypothetical protein
VIRIKPNISSDSLCQCGGNLIFDELIWQGLHIGEKLMCQNCKKTRINSLPANQAGVEQYSFFPEAGQITDMKGNLVPENWFTAKLRSIANPITDDVEIEIEIIKKFDSVLILNTLDYIYGHSLLFLLNLQRIIQFENELGIIVIVQPMLKWLIPRHGIAEIWTVKLGFKEFNYFHINLSRKINSELDRFRTVWLSKGYIIPTNINIDIEKFTGIKPYDFDAQPEKPRITFICREDPDRLWIRNIYLLKGFKKLRLGKILLPLQYLRLVYLFWMIRRKLPNKYLFTVAGLGKSVKLPQFIDDQRVSLFNDESEKQLCRIYSESELVIGVHGSAMILPSAHAGMTVSMMPSRRWGNFAEDILFREDDIRLASFQRRIIPLNLCIFDICDIVTDMIRGREIFIKKFIHEDEL